VSLSAHDHRTIDCNLPEVLEIGLQVPWQLTVASYDRIICNRSNQNDLHNADSSNAKAFRQIFIRRKSFQARTIPA
jgi:hypothetical protein